MDKKTQEKICLDVFNYFSVSVEVMIHSAANARGLTLSRDEERELKEMFNKAVPNFASLFVDYYIYTDDDED